MGKGERASAETKSQNFSGRQEENRGGTAGKVGEGEGGEEGGVASWGACCDEFAAGFPVFRIQKALLRNYTSQVWFLRSPRIEN